MFSFISPAFADSVASPAGSAANPYGSIFLLVGFVVMFYFMFIRPQNKRAREQKNLIANLQVGDTVVTSGGMLGIVRSQDDQFISVAVSKDVEIKFQKPAIVSALPKGTLDF